MTRIEIRNDDGAHSVQAAEHAGIPEVCNGISAILYALGAWLDNCGGPGCRVELEPGRASLTCPRDGPDVETAFNVATMGFLCIEKARPEAVRVLVC